jgi:hypothetical protein
MGDPATHDQVHPFVPPHAHFDCPRALLRCSARKIEGDCTNKMAFVGLDKPENVENVIAYIETFQ